MKHQKNTTSHTNKIITIPNILSFIRLCLIPLIIWLYCVKQNYHMTAVILVLSGLTDLADGFIARHFHMISDLGKILDPIADKLTQGATLFCLMTRFKLMLVPFILMIFKELYMGITGALVIKKTGQVLGANWHGKVVTCLLYAMMILHVLWYDIPMAVSTVSIIICICMMVLSLILYGKRNKKAIQQAKA